jgi:hypothetical protein
MEARRAISLLVLISGFAAAASGCVVDGRRGGPRSRTDYGAAGSYGGSGGSGGYAGYGGAGGGGAYQPVVVCAGGASDTSNFHVAWTIDDASGAPSSCDGVAALEMDLDVLNLGSNVEYHGVFACSDMAASSCAVPAGAYSFAMRLRDGKSNIISELVPPDTVTVTAGQTTDLGSIPFSASMGLTGPGQGVGLTWTVVRQGATITCDQASAATLEIDIGDQKFPFPCSDGTATSPPVAPGTYQVTLRLLDAQGNPLSVTQTMAVAIPAGKLVPLGAVPFEVI